MNNENSEKKIKAVGEIIKKVEPALSFTILEIGALPAKEKKEPFQQLLDIFPGSQILAFEVDQWVCDELNKNAKPGIRYFPVALGSKEEQRMFYETDHPMCSSLYKPNEALINKYNNMEFATLKSAYPIETVSLDYFINNNNIGSVDFIKIDIQGAELDVFQGGMNTLKEVVAIVSEVEFVHHYIDQPLFGDICTFLAENELMFHKFLGMAGRSLKPIVINNNPYIPTQEMWADAMFIKDIFKISDLSPSKLLKLGLLAFTYGSPDVTFQCFKYYDEKKGTGLLKSLLDVGDTTKKQGPDKTRRKRKKIKGLR